MLIKIKLFLLWWKRKNVYRKKLSIKISFNLKTRKFILKGNKSLKLRNLNTFKNIRIQEILQFQMYNYSNLTNFKFPNCKNWIFVVIETKWNKICRIWTNPHFEFPSSNIWNHSNFTNSGISEFVCVSEFLKIQVSNVFIILKL